MVLAMITAGTVVGMAVAELALRVIGFSSLPAGIFFMADPYTGWSNRPGASGTWSWEGVAPVSINSRGLRDVERSIEKPPGTLRIAVLGDSFVAAFQVPQDSDFCSVIERTMRACGGLDGRKPEVLNFGVNAYGTGQELLTLEHRVWQCSPDVVVLAYFPNDVFDDSEVLQKKSPSGLGDPRPFFHYSSGQLVEDDSFLRTPRFQAALKETGDPDSAFGEGFHRWLWKLRLWQLISRLRPAPQARHPEEPLLLNAPADDDWKNAWQITEGLISRFNREVRSHGARFMLAIVTHSLQVYPGAEARGAMLQKAGVSDVFYVNRRLEALGQREGFPVVSLAEPMQQYADAHQVFFHGFPRTGLGIGHWNEQGHLMAGQSIAAAICAMLSGQRAQAPATVRASREGIVTAGHPQPPAPSAILP